MSTFWIYALSGLIVSWPPAAGAMWLTWYMAKNKVEQANAAQTVKIARMTDEQTAKFGQIADAQTVKIGQIADAQTAQLLTAQPGDQQAGQGV